MLLARETILTFFVLYYLPSCPKFTFFSKLYVTFILQWIAYIFGRDEEEDQWGCHLQETQLSLSSLCTYPS